MHRVLRTIALTVLLVPLCAPATTMTPTEAVKRASDEIIGILQDPAVARTERWQQISPIISKHFDFLSMSQSILSRQWRSATPEQQQQFVDFFSQYIEGTYRSKIEAYTGQRIEYTGEKVRGDRAAVNTVIHSDGAPSIPVGYFLRRHPGGEWKAYDVTIEGVSLVNNYRETYAAIGKTSGISGVLAHVRKRARETGVTN
jgi:phospholipid transport system substrate-binding protein